MKGMELKVIVTDIDGTLTDDAMLLDLEALAAIRRLEAAGIPVVLVTARDYTTAGTLAVYMGACGVVATENGAVIGNFRLRQPPLVLGDPARVRRGLAVLQASLGDDVDISPQPGRLCSVALRRRFDLAEGLALLQKDGVEATLIDSGLAYHLIDVDTGKGRGVREAVKLLGLEAENTVVIGDNFNDLDMFAVAGYSIAVGNAPQAVKEQVDYACTARFGAGFCEGVAHVQPHLRPQSGSLDL
jgi:hypothetical protein